MEYLAGYQVMASMATFRIKPEERIFSTAKNLIQLPFNWDLKKRSTVSFFSTERISLGITNQERNVPRKTRDPAGTGITVNEHCSRCDSLAAYRLHGNRRILFPMFSTDTQKPTRHALFMRTS